MNTLHTGHDAEIKSQAHGAAIWENDVKAQLLHIIATAQSELADLDLTHDILGNTFEPGSNKVSNYALDAIIACAERIKRLQG